MLGAYLNKFNQDMNPLLRSHLEQGIWTRHPNLVPGPLCGLQC